VQSVVLRAGERAEILCAVHVCKVHLEDGRPHRIIIVIINIDGLANV
jgi:hypothetical protein